LFFGAGASFGSGEVKPKPPPLGSGLFEELQMAFPSSWGKIPDNIALHFRDFEEGMGIIWERYSHKVPRLMREMAMFFSQFIPRYGNLYYKLTDYLVKKDLLANTLFSTLNYECLLELAASDLGLKVNYFDEPANDLFTLWKLHGSCNFKLKGIEAQGIRYTRGVSFGGGIIPIQLNQVYSQFSANNSLYPAMSIYTRGKPNQMAPEFIQSLQKRWADYIMYSDLICIIGIRPHPPDKHIWEPLANTDGKILFIGNKERFESWAKENRPDKENCWIAQKFDEGIRELLSKLG